MAGLYDNFKEDAKKDYEAIEKKLDTKEGRNYVKWAAYGMLAIIVLLFVSCVAQMALAPRHVAVQGEVVATQPVAAAPVAAAPTVVYQNNPDPMTGVITGMAIGTLMSNGMRYDGHNGYYHSGYSGPPRTIVVNKTTVINKTVAAPAVKPTVTPVTPKFTPPTPVAKPAVAAPAPSKPSWTSSFSSGPSRNSSFSSSPSRSSFSSSSFSRSSFSSGGRR